MKVSIVVPSKGCKYLGYLPTGLRDQNVKPNEVVLAVKECDTKRSKICREASLSCVVDRTTMWILHPRIKPRQEKRNEKPSVII
jgi:hypothetical protein